MEAKFSFSNTFWKSVDFVLRIVVGPAIVLRPKKGQASHDIDEELPFGIKLSLSVFPVPKSQTQILDIHGYSLLMVGVG